MRILRSNRPSHIIVADPSLESPLVFAMPMQTSSRSEEDAA
jgi:hypothetical protein